MRPTAPRLHPAVGVSCVSSRLSYVVESVSRGESLSEKSGPAGPKGESVRSPGDTARSVGLPVIAMSLLLVPNHQTERPTSGRIDLGSMLPGSVAKSSLSEPIPSGCAGCLMCVAIRAKSATTVSAVRVRGTLFEPADATISFNDHRPCSTTTHHRHG